jgi:hypothetical protein
LASAAAELRRLLLGLLLLRSRLPVLLLLPTLQACRGGLLTLPPLCECSLSFTASRRSASRRWRSPATAARLLLPVWWAYAT